MITAYKVFQILLGLILSGFILFFLLRYASNYVMFGESNQKFVIIDNLRTTSQNVYLSGNPVIFEDTVRFDFSSCYPAFNEPTEQPSIKCRFGEISPLVIPFFFMLKPKERVFVDRNHVDYGWWRVYFTEAIPETHVIFIPMDASDRTWDLMKEITMAFPDTKGFNINITFGFCDETLLENICGGDLCEKKGFLNILNMHRAPSSGCSETLGDEYLFVTISDSCRPAYVSKGICIKPVDEGIGYVYTPRSQDEFVYKDVADILSLILGGNQEDPFGISRAEKLYEYKNNLFMERLYLAARIMQMRAHILRSEYQSRCNPSLNSQSTYCVCHPLYDNLYSKLDDVIRNLRNDYTEYSEMESLKSSLDEAESVYQDLVKWGCET